MLVEAIDVIRGLWAGNWLSYYGSFYTVEKARLYTLPDKPPLILVAAAGKQSAELAGQIGDGFINTKPKAELVQAFTRNGGQDNPIVGKLAVCWNRDEAAARRIAYEYFPTFGLKGQLDQELALPQFFEQATSVVTEDQVAQNVICGPDPERHIAGVRRFIDAGFNHVYVHQIGPDQEGFFRFYADEILPKL
jgi:G6PDH family F420-dependent oxidoreductase